MKIKVVNFMDGEVRFVVDDFPKSTFCIKLTGNPARSEITAELKTRVQARIDRKKNPKKIYDDLNLKGLEGTDI